MAFILPVTPTRGFVNVGTIALSTYALASGRGYKTREAAIVSALVVGIASAINSLYKNYGQHIDQNIVKKYIYDDSRVSETRSGRFFDMVVRCVSRYSVPSLMVIVAAGLSADRHPDRKNEKVHSLAKSIFPVIAAMSKNARLYEAFCIGLIVSVAACITLSVRHFVDKEVDRVDSVTPQ